MHNAGPSKTGRQISWTAGAGVKHQLLLVVMMLHVLSLRTSGLRTSGSDGSSRVSTVNRMTTAEMTGG